MLSISKCAFVLFALLLAVVSSVFALTITNPIVLPNNTMCLPRTIPSISLPSDFLTCAEEVRKAGNATNPDQDKTTGEIIIFHGYSLEIHNVTTDDGYILTLHRITGSPVSPPTLGKPSVYVHHGMAGSSDAWLLQDGDSNLAFKLADAGYDVWLANCRGTTYSLGHTSLNSETDVRYWDFSWHEMAMYDVPATINKISAVSGNDKMFYIGYSMGTTVNFISMSEMPTLNNKIITAFLLAPVGFIGHSNIAIRLLAPSLGTGEQYLLDPVLRGRIDQPAQFQRLFGVSAGDFCTPTAARCLLCNNFLFALFGFDAPQMNYTNLPNILSKFPNIVSVKTLVHYAQSMQSCGFRQFDYGITENMRRYNCAIPPAYNLSKITTPTYLIYGEADNLAVPQDVAITQSNMLPSTVLGSFRVDWDLFNHLDFQFAKDAKTLVYNQILQLMNNIRSQSTN